MGANTKPNGQTKKNTHTHEKVCEQALLWALASQDLSFALRMCEHVDDEGMVLDHDVRDMAFRKVGSAIDQLPYTAAFNVNAGVDVGTDDDTDDAATTPFGAAAGAQAVGAGGDSEDAIDGDGDVGEWKVEGTNATVSQLWELQRLLQRCVGVRSCIFACLVGLFPVHLNCASLTHASVVLN